MTDRVRVHGGFLGRVEWNADVSYVPAFGAQCMIDGSATDDFGSHVVDRIGGFDLRLKEYETNEEEERTWNAKFPADYKLVLRHQSMYRPQHWSIRSFGSEEIQYQRPY